MAAIMTTWCECPVCEWSGLAIYGETLCYDCGTHLLSRCWAPCCENKASLHLSDRWTCTKHIPEFRDDDTYEQWTVAQLGDYEVVEAEGYTIRGAGSLRMAVLTLTNGILVSVPLDAVFLTSERRTRLSAGAYCLALWLTDTGLSKEQAYSNLDPEKRRAIKPQQVPASSARWDYQPEYTYMKPLPMFRELDTPDESFRWVIRYTAEEAFPILRGE